MFERLKERFARNALLEQVDSLPDQAMSDLGISRGQLNSLARIPEKVQARMGKMADRFGADIAQPEDLDFCPNAKTYRDAAAASV